MINENLYSVCVVVCSNTPGTEHTTTETGYIHVHLTVNCCFATSKKRLILKKMSTDQILTAQHTHMHTPVSPWLPTQICIKINQLSILSTTTTTNWVSLLALPSPPFFWGGGGEGCCCWPVYKSLLETCSISSTISAAGKGLRQTREDSSGQANLCDVLGLACPLQEVYGGGETGWADVMQLGNLRTQLLEWLALHRLNGSLRDKKPTQISCHLAGPFPMLWELKTVHIMRMRLMTMVD